MGEVVTGEKLSMKTTLSGILFFFFIFSGSPVFSSPPGIELIRENEKMAVGTIQALQRNTFEICDETDGTVKRLVYLDRMHRFQAGDRVRVYYTPNGYMVKLIKKMTPVKYLKDGQNLGYINRSR